MYREIDKLSVSLNCSSIQSLEVAFTSPHPKYRLMEIDVHLLDAVCTGRFHKFHTSDGRNIYKVNFLE